jgi:hypothetical protein
VWKLLRNLLSPAQPPLTGAPAVRRQKTYSATSGYVYQYYYEGQRPASREGDPGAEFVFDVCADRKHSFPVSVWICEAGVAAWETAHGRGIYSNERYAIAKMALFQAFDERDNPDQMRLEVRVRPADLDAILETLGIE